MSHRGCYRMRPGEPWEGLEQPGNVIRGLLHKWDKFPSLGFSFSHLCLFFPQTYFLLFS